MDLNRGNTKSGNGDICILYLAGVYTESLITLNVINAEEYEQLKESKSTVVIDFHATWCGPCQILSPILL